MLCTVLLCPSHGNPALLIKAAGTVRVWGPRWPHNARTLSQTNTQSDSGADTGPKAACDVRPEDRCGQTSPSTALLLGQTQQMAQAQAPTPHPLHTFLSPKFFIRLIRSINF